MIDLLIDIIKSFLLQKWGEIIGQASQRVEVLKDQDVIRTVLNILQVIRTCVVDSACCWFLVFSVK